MNIEIELVISQIIAFLILLWVMKRFAWQPLLNAMEDRKNKIQSDFDHIDEQKKKYEGLVKEYSNKISSLDEQAKLKFQEEFTKGQKASQDIINQAHEQAKQIITQAKDDAENEVHKAKVLLKNDIVNLVIASTQKIIQKELEDPNKQKVLVEKLMEQSISK